MKRRALLSGAVAAGGLAAGGLMLRGRRPRASATDRDASRRDDVFIAAAPSYEVDLERIVSEGLRELGVRPEHVRGKSVMLKPNLVEPAADAPHINTHPSLVRAVADVFRRLGAGEVFVAEGQGHCRDSYLVLEQSGLGDVLDDAGIDFVDLNHDALVRTPNRFGATSMRTLMLPRSLRRADIVVSMPKLKTHHWVGVTLSMKNLFGVMPSVFYGWPKNVLHQMGIERSILDIYAAVRPSFAIVDGIVAMEGDGPIMGEPRQAGVIVLGRSARAVDATATRLMGLDPLRIAYLAAAPQLGAIDAAAIRQRGENLSEYAQSFALLDHPTMARFRG